MKDYLDKLRAQLREVLEKRATERKVITSVRTKCEDEKREPTEAELQQSRDASQRVDEIDKDIVVREQKIAELEVEIRADEEAEKRALELNPTGARVPADRAPARVGAEERTYSPEKSRRGEASFFMDAFGAQRGNALAAERLQRNLREAQVEREISERATSTSSFSGLVVPQYLIDLAAPVLRAGRPVANACRALPLPDQGMTLTVTRGTTGAAVASQAAENTSVQNTDEAFADLTIPVRTISGQQDVSRQSLERGSSGLDELVYMDLAGAYHAELDRQVINGSGASGQMLGMLQTAGIGAATAYGAVLDYPTFNRKMAGQIAGIAATGAGITPRLIAMNPRRWGWMTALVDGQNRPLVIPTAQGLFNAGGINSNPGGYGGDPDPDGRETTIVGSMQGLPITTDANIPVTVGANNEDPALIFDPAQALLWEDGNGQPKELRFEQTLGNQLTVKLVIYNYAAFTAARYPQAFGKTGGVDATAGQGQVAPTF